jgi:hypothetical protein
MTLAVEHAVRLQPRRILDIGFGFGKWGFLLREALDFVGGRVAREDWQVTIDGIDARGNSSPVPGWVYDDVRIGDALELVGELEPYDLVVMGDVIEHFDKAVGVSLLRALLAKNRNVLLTTPYAFFEQEIEGNPWERHRSHWTIDDFRPWAFDYDVVGGALIVLLAGRDADRPRPVDTRASRIAYGLPLLRRRGAGARVVKSILRSFS